MTLWLPEFDWLQENWDISSQHLLWKFMVFISLQKLSEEKKMYCFMGFLEAFAFKSVWKCLVLPFPHLGKHEMLFISKLRHYFGAVLLLKFQVNTETLSGQKGHLVISLRAFYLLWLQPMLVRELTLSWWGWFLWKSFHFLSTCTDAFIHIPNKSGRFAAQTELSLK